MSDTIAPSPPQPTHRWLALLIVLTAQLMIVLDGTVVNVALPAIQKDLGFSEAHLTWVINAYLISFGSLLLVAGRLGDLVGRRKVFLIGIALFTAASVACAMAGDKAVLIGARFAQGVGGALASAAVLALIVSEFPQPQERAKAMTAYIMVSTGGGSVGLLFGGLLTQSLSWHWIFIINIPIGVVGLVAATVVLKERPGLGLGRGADVLGALLVTASALIGIDAIVQAAGRGWLSVQTVGLGLLSLALLAGFLLREARTKNPLMPLRILALRSLMTSSLIRAVIMTGMFGTFFLGVLFLQRVLGYDAIHTGFAFLPQTVAVLLLSLGVTRRLTDRFGPRTVLLAGMVLLLIGLVLLASAGTDTHYAPRLLLSFSLVGFGAGMAFVPLLAMAMSDVPAADAGLASGIVNTSMQISGAVGLAVLGTVSTHRTEVLRGHGRSARDALAGGCDLGLVIAACCVLVGIVLALTLLRSSRAERAHGGPIDSGAAARTGLRRAAGRATDVLTRSPGGAARLEASSVPSRG